MPTLSAVPPAYNSRRTAKKLPGTMPEARPGEVLVWTDGACQGNPGRGGWAAILVDDAGATVDERAGGSPQTTNNIMEMTAALEGMRALGTEVGRAVASWTDFFERYDTAKYGSQGAPLHDPCVIAYLIRPELFTGRHIHVAIETKGQHTLGMTVADWWRVTDHAPNAMFMGGVDRDAFFALLTERIGRL